MTTIDDIKKKSVADLRKSVVELSKQMFELRMQKASGVEVKTDRFAKLKKDRARLLTFISQKQQGGN